MDDNTARRVMDALESIAHNLERFVTSQLEGNGNRETLREGLIQTGDRVQLLGRSWSEWDLRGEIVTITDVTEEEAHFWHDGLLWAVYENEEEDYSAMKVSG